MKSEELKKEDTINRIVEIIEKMDKHLADYEKEEKTTQNRLKEWFFEKEALHDIRHILHEIDKYENDDYKELRPVDENFMELGLDAQTASFMRDYFC